jgi:phosphoglycerate kinase
MQHKFLTLNDIPLTGQRILFREDFNVPIESGVVQSDLRIRAALPGIRQALQANASVMLMSHLGRPQAGVWQEQFSLRPVVKVLEKLLDMPIQFVSDWFIKDFKPETKLVLFENVRFLRGETENDAALATQMAQLCDIFVMDAFGSAHRAHASTVGVAEFAPIAVSGPLLSAEVTALDKLMLNPKSPVVAVIGGAKVSTKLAVLQSLTKIADVLIVGGGMANTLLASQGFPVGNSLYEPDLIPNAKKLMQLAVQNNCEVLLPIDVVSHEGKIFDIGPKTIGIYSEAIATAATILWNGPMGVFEDPAYANGTALIAKAIANSTAYSVAGGGDTLAAIDNLCLTEKISYISTGGGAFLEYIEGQQLPAIKALCKSRTH